MSYQLYRNTTLGNTLQESLDELISVSFMFLSILFIHPSVKIIQKTSKSIFNPLFLIKFQYGQITPQLALKVLLQFDKSINQALSNKVKSRITFKASKLNTYRFCDNVWTLM